MTESLGLGKPLQDFETIRQAEWTNGGFSTPLPLLLLRWNFAVIEGAVPWGWGSRR